MSRGGTKKARAEQKKKRATRDRAAGAQVNKRAARAPKPKQGRGKALLVHLMSLLAPLLLVGGLVVSGQLAASVLAGDAFWLDGVIGDPNAPFYQEPLGIIYMVLVFSLAAALFWLTMIVGWRRVYSDVDMLDRDWSSVDQSFTLLTMGAMAWLVRAVFGYTVVTENIIVMMSLMTLYIPLFSAGLALVLPIVPGSGRIGGVLPDFLKFPFTERYLMDDEQRAAAAQAKDAIRLARRASRTKPKESEDE